VLTSSTCSGANSIDPGLLMDTSGNWWLSFGSFFGGIKMVQINPSTGRLLNSTCYSLANRLVGTAIEGAYVYPHGGYYYLFASLDACCDSTSSTYHVVVGRSTSPNGPFTDRGGLAMTSGGGTIVVATHGNIIGPGGESVFPDADGDIFVYHYYDGNNSGNVTLGVNRLAWTSDGWPYLD
jgi:arabinan endo-1,5-alpha-L-arabinosidase